MISRRGLISGLLVTLATPAIIRTPRLLMPIRPVKMLTLAEFADKMFGDIMDPWQKELLQHYTDAIIYGYSELKIDYGPPRTIHCLPPSEWRQL